MEVKETVEQTGGNPRLLGRYRTKKSITLVEKKGGRKPVIWKKYATKKGAGK